MKRYKYKDGSEVYSSPEVRLRPADMERAFETVMAAKDSGALPVQSDYHVMAAAYTSQGIYTGGNKEYAHSNAWIHGETSALDNALENTGELPSIIGFYSPNLSVDDIKVAPCGDCRDILCSHLPKTTLIVAGDENRIKINTLGDFLFDNYQEETPRQRMEFDELDALRASVDNGIVTFLPEHLRNNVYGVALSSQRKIWRGSHYSDVSYFSVLAGVRAKMRYLDDEQACSDLTHISIAGFGGDDLPHVFYSDRQALLGLDDELRAKTGRSEPLPVKLMSLDRASGMVLRLATTNTEQWLPSPFTPKHLGMDVKTLTLGDTYK